jgi:hypothetical protein
MMMLHHIFFLQYGNAERVTGTKIEKDWPIALPAPAPDLNPLDFYLCIHLKPTVYAT